MRTPLIVGAQAPISSASHRSLIIVAEAPFSDAD